MNHASDRILLAAAALGLALVACSSLPELPRLLAGEATPTPAAAVQAQPTPQTQRTLQIEGGPTVGAPRETRVAISDRVLTVESLAAESYSQEELAVVGTTYTYTVALDEDQRLLWLFGWCATTAEILDQNLEHMQLDFYVRDTRIDLSQFEVVENQSQGLECRYFATVVYDWPAGTTRLESVVTFTETVNDGLSDYVEGSQSFVYFVTGP